jgi:GT2 family glycosyltransferase
MGVEPLNRRSGRLWGLLSRLPFRVRGSERGLDPALQELKLRRALRKSIANATAAFDARDWSVALEKWDAIASEYGDFRAAATMSRLYLSVAERLSDPTRYMRCIEEYRARFNSNRADRLRIAVYTAIVGSYDSIKPPHVLNPRCEYVAFSDGPVASLGIFDVRPVTYIHEDPTRTARYVKTHPHVLLDDCDVAVWIDSNVMMVADIEPLVVPFLASGVPMAAVPHPHRRTITEELDECIRRKKDLPEVMQRQVAAYLEERLKPTDLFETNFMIFDLRRLETRKFLDAWWAEIERHSRRDQLSLGKALRWAGIDPHRLTEAPNSVRNHPFFAMVPHDRGQGPTSLLIEAVDAGEVDPYAAPSYATVREKRIRAQATRAVDIVICVHNALDDVKLCLESVAAKRQHGNQRTIVIDDGSGDSTASFLRDFAAGRDWVTLKRNGEPVGYTKAANQGMALSTAPFVILLNSDTIVTDGWAEKLADALHSTKGAGIVGPLSNAASHQSIPNHVSANDQTAVNDLPPGRTADDMNALCEAWTPATILPRVPLVHGFCFGIAREVLDTIGRFDETNFPRGYGEENDYCFRAADAGFGLVVATHTFVFHAKSKSYRSADRVPLMKAGSEALKRMHGADRVRRSVRSMQANPLFERFRKEAALLFGTGGPASECGR